MVSKGRRLSKRKVSKRRTVTKKVNKNGYTYKNKFGTKVNVGPYDRKVRCFPNPYFTYRMINGEQRLVKITRKNGKEYVHVVEDRRKAQPITYAEAKKHFEKLPEHRQEADRRYRAKTTFKQTQIPSSYITETGTSRYDIEGLDTPKEKRYKDEVVEKVIAELAKEREPYLEKQKKLGDKLRSIDKENRNLDIILQYPRGEEQKQLVQEYKENQKILSDINSREHELELLKKFRSDGKQRKRPRDFYNEYYNFDEWYNRRNELEGRIRFLERQLPYATYKDKEK